MTYERLLLKLAEQDDRLLVLTAENRAAIRNLPPRLGPRFLDTGICEQTLIGMAAGLALRGRIPVVHALASFLTMRAFEFIRTDIGIAHLPVKLVGYLPGLLSEANGPTHQALEDIALMRAIPGMRVFCPSDREELLLGLPTILPDAHPWYIRFNQQNSDLMHNPVFKIGQAELVLDGQDATILTHGTLLVEACRTALLLKARGLSVRVLNLRTLEPLDEAAILAAARDTRLLVIIEDHFVRGGLCSAVAELLVNKPRRVTVLPFALPNRWFKPALLHEVLVHEGFTAERIAERIALELMNFGR
ncbi:MAG: transketolase [candidate division KSB1 bacterium]|nr:transketolase [candidate division KSB1 bacterium]MDZ7276175.1 transketolase [candidate division KSB1 bacterium]MDZ7287045.1 transketolase [candidate division KSB1 bacterium]MDZ7297030.1 transketolase [candidate division KSB1 bacterium]MDZ7309365.1 transketolase [candidate division KSB1 bacterium]